MILEAYNNIKESFNRQSVSQDSIEGPKRISKSVSSSILNASAATIQAAWRRYKAQKLLAKLKILHQVNHTYFTPQEVRYTLSKSPLATKIKQREKFEYPTGGSYKGEWLGGFRHGQGTMKWPDGCMYSGSWSFGYPFGEGVFKHVDGETYEGRWINPFAGGTETSTSFLENLVSGKRDGFLWLWHKQESIKSSVSQKASKFTPGHAKKVRDLKAKFRQIKKDLEAPQHLLHNLFKSESRDKEIQEIEYENGVKYIGETVEGSRHGRGRNIWPNGDKYEGEWSNDMQNGWGRNVWTDGSHYTGFYKNNFKHGIGHYIWEDGTNYLGEWKNNSIEGIGKYIWADGREYLGDWVEGIMNGFGIFTWPDGNRYEGDWEQGKKHGKGYTISSDGSNSRHMWHHGKIVQKLQ